MPRARTARAIRPVQSRVARWLLASLGVGCVGLGVVGAIVPGMPTTVFLIVAVWCFARSCPWLEDRLLNNRLLAPFMGVVREWGERGVMPRRARVIALCTMWPMIALSTWMLVARAGFDLAWTVGLMATAGVAGTWSILSIGRGERRG